MPYHHASTFAPGPRRPLTRDQRRIWTARVELHRRARQITATHALVAAALLRRLGEDGRLDPAQDTLAHDAGCCPRTVSEALRRLRRVGLLDWVRRLVRTRQGVRQTSNAYRMEFGESLAKPCIPRVPPNSGQTRYARRTRHGTPTHESIGDPAARAALARIAQERTARLAEKNRTRPQIGG